MMMVMVIVVVMMMAMVLCGDFSLGLGWVWGACVRGDRWTTSSEALPACHMLLHVTMHALCSHRAIICMIEKI
eukprot:9613657-Karenia_brevis.AAC.1